MKYFYTKFIFYDTILEELDKMDLSEDEKNHLAGLVDSQLHHAILDEILSNLKEEDKELFIRYLEQGDNDKIIQFLNERIDGVEDKIKKVSDELVKEIHRDIKEAKGVK